MDNNKNMLLLRYIIILILIISVSLYSYTSVDPIVVILTLIFIINNQVRCYLIKNRQIPVLLSLFIEWAILYLISHIIKEVRLLFYIIGIVDSFVLLDGVNKYIASITGLGSMILLSQGTESLANNIILFVSISILSFIIGEDYRKKLKIESLYDELRISKDKLIKTNQELENYANSIKELSILKERNRISREIHDSVGHSLSTIIIQLSAIEKIAPLDGNTASEMANSLGDFARNGLKEIRTALRELKPREFEKYEIIFILEELIKDFSKLTGVEIKLNTSKAKWALTNDQSLAVYRVVQEFLSNSVKHGKASKINILLHFNPNNLIVTLQDNGIGSKKIVEGIGLKSISERAAELGGKVNYSSNENKGFFLRLVLNRQEDIFAYQEN